MSSNVEESSNLAKLIRVYAKASWIRSVRIYIIKEYRHKKRIRYSTQNVLNIRKDALV